MMLLLLIEDNVVVFVEICGIFSGFLLIIVDFIKLLVDIVVVDDDGSLGSFKTNCCCGGMLIVLFCFF